MYDFLSFVRDTGVEVTILPPGEGVLICLEVREAEHGFCERRAITDSEAASCGNIDIYTGQVLDRMVARIGAKKAQEYAARHKSKQMRDREDFFREV